ncbi:MAG TPA: hypothetical protein VLH39_05260, partial [Magnetospirillaceae bacterium]|nr:hypothetical protein [Magnetospirillaceae bacterium]
MSAARLVSRVVRGYARVIRSAWQGIVVMVGLILLAVGISYPVWWLAVNHRGLYTALAGASCLA